MSPALFSDQDILVGGDTLLVHYPWFVLWRNSLALGELPFWNPYTLSGLPAFPTLQSGYGYPPHWALTNLHPVIAINWLLLGHVLLAGLGATW